MTSFFDDEKQVIPLITCENGQYSVSESTLEWLESIGEFGVIACAGKYRTGKSFLLNRLASAESNTGFGVGDSVQACTKGLWIFKRVFHVDGKNIVFIDTEGIDALDANDTHDVRIFTLALLLSSTFVYNSIGPIDETSLQTLSLMTRVTENVKFDAENDSIKALAPHMPRFYWILRDFSLKLTNKNNEDITENEYLEEALRESSDPNKNKVREAIRSSFPQRALVTLPRPSTNIDPTSQRMEDRLMSLSRSFLNGVDKLRNRLFEEIIPMKAQDSTINGKMYSILCRHYTDIIQSNAVPVIKDSWSLIASVQARDIKDSLIAECTQKLSTMKPKTKEHIDEDMKILKNSVLDKFNKLAMKPIDVEVKEMLVKQLDEHISNARRHLEIDLNELIEKSFAKIDPLIAEKPDQLSAILNKALEDFSEEHDKENDKEFAKAWMVAASERALCRWIPRSLQSLASERDDKIEQLSQMEDRMKLEMKELKESNEELLRDEKVRHSELEQLNESNKAFIEREQEENMRLRMEVIVYQSEIRNLEHLKSLMWETQETQLCETGISEDENVSKLQDDISQYSIECAELKSKLSLELSNSEKLKRMNKDLNERLEKAMSMQAQLEQNWKLGIERLREEQEENVENQRKDYETRLKVVNEEMTRITAEYENKCNSYSELLNEKKRVEDKWTQEVNVNEKTTSNLRETNQRYREQADKSQQRVLEIHKSMLEDLRIRDDRAREQQSKYLKESAEIQQKLTDASRENEAIKHENQQMKRRLVQLESIEVECKKLKTMDREKEILISQLKAESTELRASNNEMLVERENIRKENMRMEGELSLLRAEKQLADARKAMTK